MKSALTWFEIPVRDIIKAKVFYENVFQIKLSESTVNQYKLAIFPATEVSGALIEEAGYVGPERSIILYLHIPDSIEAVLKRVENNAGKIVTPKTLIQEEVGWSASFRDIDGNMIGLYQAV
jgi:hypothetical protein